LSCNSSFIFSKKFTLYNILSFHFRVPCTLSYLSLNMLLVFYQYFNQLAVLTERERKGTNFFFPSKFFLKIFYLFSSSFFSYSNAINLKYLIIQLLQKHYNL